MAKLPAIHLYPGDWLRDQISGCSLAAQGLWLRMMFVMHDSEQYGRMVIGGKPIPFDQAARRCGCSVQEYSDLTQELLDVGVISINSDGVMYSRRMVRDAKERETTKIRVGRFRGKQPVTPVKRSCNADVTVDVTPMYEDESDKEDDSSLKGGVGGNGADELIARIRAIGPWRYATAMAAESALVDELASGADGDELFKALCRIAVWTKNCRFAPRLSETIPRWREPQQNWEREEKPNGQYKSARERRDDEARQFLREQESQRTPVQPD